MERRVEAGDLNRVRERRPGREHACKVVGLMQRRELDEAGQLVDDAVGDDDGRRVLGAAVNDTMADRRDLDRRKVRLHELEDMRERMLMVACLVAGEHPVFQNFAVPALHLQVRLKADPLDLAHRERLQSWPAWSNRANFSDDEPALSVSTQLCVASVSLRPGARVLSCCIGIDSSD